MIRPLRVFFLLSLFALAAVQLNAQVTTGTPPFGSFGGGPEVINLANLNSHISIPVLHKSGRGANFMYDLSYDSSVWYPVTSGSTTSWQPVLNWGWRGVTESLSGFVTSGWSYTYCYTTVCNSHHCYQEQTGTTTRTNGWVYHDPFGIPHPFVGSTVVQTGTCGSINNPSFQATTTDGSGYTLSVANSGSQHTITSTNGNIVVAPWQSSAGTGTFTDRNGNEITVNSSGQFFDTLSSSVPVLTVTGSGTAASPMVFSYTPPGGTPYCAATNSSVACVTVNYTNYTVATNFAVSGINETKSSAAVPLVSSVVLPDGSQYTVSYEATPSTPASGACTPYAGTTCVTARIHEVTLPTGGTITYTYSGGAGANGSGIFSDGSTAILQRALTAGSNWSATWNYSRTQETGAASITTVTDPNSPANQTVIQFQGIYETQRDVYSGSAPTISTFPVPESTLQTSNLKKEIQTCYNTNTSNCTSTAIILPITQRNVTTLLSGASSWASSLTAQSIFQYDSYGNLTAENDSDYGKGTPGSSLKLVNISYASLTNIHAFRQQVSIYNRPGALVSQTNYNYGDTVTATTGTPQLTTPAGSRGNLLSVNYYTQGSNYITKSYSYYDTGNVYVATDVNNGQTTYTYGSGSCGNSFPTSITEAVSGLSRSMAWNCTGGVQTSVTDENGNTTSASYTKDPYYWRPESTTDAANVTTNYCYGLLSTSGSCTVNPKQVESTITINSLTSVDMLATLDGLGRSQVKQTRQGPSSSNFDTVETDYDVVGRTSRVTMPYSGTEGQTCSSCPATTTGYDALNHVSLVTDGGGGQTYYTPSNNDVVVEIVGQPSGENPKQRQLEYNGLGQLTSVCEVTNGTSAYPGGSCAQNNALTGYWTQYTYDAIGDLTGVTQNAQSSGNSQTRSYTYDLMARRTSETNPEIGPSTGATPINYTYDTSTSPCTGTYSGDLVQKVDPQGTTTCFTYDALHRNTSITYSGGYASVTPNKYFVYDAATVNGTLMTNVRARLAEAYTGSSKTTDLGFSYTARGEVSDVYESTPNSGGYYHVNQTYWAHGLPYQLSQLVGMPTISYGGTINSTVGLDPEGRVTQVTASSGQNPVTGVNYNLYGNPPQQTVTFGSGDSDVFNYDPDTFRMTQYQFNVGTAGLSDTGTLTWNANSTLYQLVIADAFNSNDNQTCTYGYDDVVRVTSAKCGTAANQTFTYDPFGNISKSGSPYSFNPIYSIMRNRISTVGSTTAQYDNNGNVLADSVHNYTWDADGNSITVDTVGATFDALDRMVEQNRSSVYTQIVYAPTGGKLALMTGQTLKNVFVNLPGKAAAVYTSAGLDHYRHSDWLGSARLTSSPSRTYLYSVAYAPFGETYGQPNSGTPDPSFTGQNSDTVSEDYDFLAREYSTQSRWPSPDPAGQAAVDPMNPQSWNRYANVMNNPLAVVDPTGLDGCNIWNVSYEGSGPGFPCTDPLNGGDAPGPVVLPPLLPQLQPPPQYDASLPSPEGAPAYVAGPPAPLTIKDENGNIIFQGCGGPTGTANEGTNCGFHFGEETSTIPKWYLDEANLNSTTSYTLSINLLFFLPGSTPTNIPLFTETSGWQVIYQEFGITNLTGPSFPNPFQQTRCYGQLMNVPNSKVGTMSATCSGL